MTGNDRLWLYFGCTMTTEGIGRERLACAGLQQPLPVILTPDGALLVGDRGTGTAYRIAVAS